MPAPSDGARLLASEKGLALAPPEVEVPITPRPVVSPDDKHDRPPGKWIAPHEEVRIPLGSHDLRAHQS